MSFFHPFLEDSQLVTNGLISTFNSNTLGNLFTTGGNVGIGKTTPTSALDVNGTINASSISTGTFSATSITSANVKITGVVSANSLSVNNGNFAVVINNTVTGGETSMLFNNGSDTNTSWYVGHNVGAISSGNFGFFNNALGTTVTILGTNGNMGIGTKIPAYKLDVNGTAKATTYTGGSMQLSGTVSAATFVGSLVSTGSIGAAGITTGTLYAATITSANVQVSGTISAATFVGSLVSTGSVGAPGATIGTLYATTITSANVQLSGTISAGTHVGSLFSAGSLGAAGITVGNIYNTGTMMVGRTSTTANWDATESCVAISATEGSGRAVILLGNHPSASNQNWHIVNEGGPLNIINGNYGSGISKLLLNTSGNLYASGQVAAGTDLRAPGSLWIGSSGGAVLGCDGTTSQWTLPGSNNVWTSDTSYNFNVSKNLNVNNGSGSVSAGTFVGSLVTSSSLGVAGATVGTLYATSITSANVQVSGTVSAGTLATPLVTSSSLGVAGATIGTLYSNSISMNYMSVDSGRMVGSVNQTASNITGFNFSSSYDSFISYLTIRTPGASEVLTLIGFKTPGSNVWRMDQVSSGDYTQVPVDITTSGQLIYSAPNAGSDGPIFSWFTQRVIT